MMRGLKMKVTKMMVGALCMMVLLLTVAPFTQVEAATKAVSKKSITVSLDKKHPTKYCMLQTTNLQTISNVSIKIIEMKGKPKQEDLDYLFISEEEDGSGPLWWNDVRASKMKKGAKLPIDVKRVQGCAFIQFDMPEGVKSITYKVTFSNINNKKTIKKVTLEKSWDVWTEYWSKIHEK